MATGVAIRHLDSSQEAQELKLLAAEGTAKRQGMLWVAAMQKVRFLHIGGARRCIQGASSSIEGARS